MTMRNTRLRPSSPDPWHNVGAEGSTITEVMISIAIITLAFTGAATLWAIQNRSLLRSNNLSTVQSQLDGDVAAVRNLAETYTWCSGNGGFNGSATNCAGATAGTENYYFPIASATSAINTFETACNNAAADTLNDPNGSSSSSSLVKAINNIELPSLVDKRIVEFDDLSANRLRITYTTSTGASRIVVLTPTVAAWCP